MYAKYPILFSDLNQTFIFSPDLQKKKKTETPSTGGPVVPCGQTNGRTGMTTLTVVFRSLAKAPKSGSSQGKWKICVFLQTPTGEKCWRSAAQGSRRHRCHRRGRSGVWHRATTLSWSKSQCSFCQCCKHEINFRPANCKADKCSTYFHVVTKDLQQTSAKSALSADQNSMWVILENTIVCLRNCLWWTQFVTESNY